jgi:hypothetical protein
MVFFELIPERSEWSIPVKPEEEHMLAIPGSGYSVLLMQKQGKEYSSETKEDEYEKQYNRRRRILIIDDEPDITLTVRMIY